MKEVTLLSEHCQHSKDIKDYKYCVYLIYNSITHKVYIGQAFNLWERLVGHLSNSKKGNRHLHKSIRKYGRENFKLYVLEKDIDLDCLDMIETAFIQVFKAYNKEYGYNILPSAKAPKGYQFPENSPYYEKRKYRKVCQLDSITFEVINIFNSIIEAEIFMSGKKSTNISGACRGKNITAYGFRWKYFEEDLIVRHRKKPALSEEYVKSLAIRLKDNPICKTKEVQQIDKNTLIIIQTFKSAMDASQQLNINYSTIGDCCRGKIDTAGNYRWKYTDRELKIRPIPLRLQPKRRKKVAQIDLQTKEVINIFDSLKEASALTGIPRSTISLYCSNKVQNPIKFNWKFIKDIT